MSRIDLPFERRVLDGLGRILFDGDDIESAGHALRTVASRLVEVPAIAYKHKVTTIISRNAQILTHHRDDEVTELSLQLAALLRDEMTQAMAHRVLLENELLRLVDTLDVSATIIKGFSNARFYPSSYLRWMRDIDLLTANWEDAMTLIEKLLQEGYMYDGQEAPWVKADALQGRNLYGQIFLIRPEGDDFCRIDIHYGTYSVGYSGYLDIDVDDATTFTKVGNLDVRVLKPEACLLIAQAHALSDGYVAIKDINDFVAIATSGEDVDWVAVGAALHRHKLTPQMTLLAEHVLTLYTDPRVVSAARIILTSFGGRRRSIWQTHNRSWRLRAAVNTSFTFRWQLGKGDGVAGSAMRAFQCYLFYIRRLKLAVRQRKIWEKVLRRLMAQPDLVRWRLRPDACTLLIDATVVQHLAAAIPKAEAGKLRTVDVEDGIELINSGGYYYLRMRNVTFVPTLDLIISPRQAAALPGFR